MGGAIDPIFPYLLCDKYIILRKDTVEPLNKGHFGIRSTVPCREVVLISGILWPWGVTCPFLTRLRSGKLEHKSKQASIYAVLTIWLCYFYFERLPFFIYDLV